MADVVTTIVTGLQNVTAAQAAAQTAAANAAASAQQAASNASSAAASSVSAETASTTAQTSATQADASATRAESAVAGVPAQVAAEATARVAGDAANAAATALVTKKVITNISPKLRGPLQSDDISRGYQVQTAHQLPSRWLKGNEAYICNQNTAGFGAWLRNAAAFGYPGSGISETGVLFAGGTLRMVAGYTGKAINVVNPVTSANMDIGLLGDDSLDEMALWSFMGTAGYLQVATIYDQTGNANHITQTTAAHRYVIVPGMRLGRAVALINDSENFGAAVEKWMTIPNTLTVAAGGSVTGAVVMNMRNYNTSLAPIALIGSDTHTYGITISQAGVVGNSAVAINNIPPAPINGFVAAFGTASSGGACHLAVDTMYGGPFGTVGGISFTGGYLGTTGGALQGTPHEIAGVMIYGALVPAPGDINTLMLGLEHHFQLAPQVVDNLLLDGDSITYGYGSSYNQNYPRQMQSMLTHDFKIRNVGFFGETSAARLAAQPQILTNLTGLGTQNVYVIWVGTNDIAGNGSIPLSTTQANVSALVAAAKAAGYKTVVVTCLPRGGFSGTAMETNRLAYNAWMVQGGSGADAVADVASDPTMGNYANNPAGLYYIDAIHPTSLGYSFIAPIIAKAINSLVP